MFWDSSLDFSECMEIVYASGVEEVKSYYRYKLSFVSTLESGETLSLDIARFFCMDDLEEYVDFLKLKYPNKVFKVEEFRSQF